jgi:hypothetical protein
MIGRWRTISTGVAFILSCSTAALAEPAAVLNSEQLADYRRELERQAAQIQGALAMLKTLEDNATKTAAVAAAPATTRTPQSAAKGP